MSDSIPVHLRIALIAPTNEDVDSRRAAASILTTAWNKTTNVATIFERVAAVAESLGGDGFPTERFGEEVQKAVQKHASAFLYEDRPLEVGVCAGAAVISMLKGEPGKGGWSPLDAHATALWSALSFQAALAIDKRESLRQEVLGRAQQWSIASAEKARERDVVADPGELVVTIGGASPTTNFKKAVQGTVDALRRNAALDREEIDFLWWSQHSRSKILNRAIASIPESTRLVALGIEASTHLRRLPAQVHRDLVLRTVNDDALLTLGELIGEISEDRAALVSALDAERVEAHPAIFPLLNAILAGSGDVEGGEVKQRASTWGARALLESALVKMMATGLVGK